MKSYNLNNVSICDFLKSQGHIPVKSTHGEHWYLSPLRKEETASFKVDERKNLWYDFGIGKGGNMIALLQAIFNTEDYEELRNHISDIPSISVQKLVGEPQPAITIVDVNNGLYGSLLNYAYSRGIIDSVISKYCKTVVFHNRNRETDYYAIGFQNNSGGFELRNAYFKGCIAPKDITLIGGENDHCIVFEGFMDFLSFMTIFRKGEYDDHDFLVLNSTSMVKRAADNLQRYEAVSLMLDHDETGRRATGELIQALGDKCTDGSDMYHDHKDLSEFLGNMLLESKEIIIPTIQK